jgi:hypothetical protein
MVAVTDLDRLVIYSRSDDRDLIPLSSPTTSTGANSTTIATGIAIGFTFTFDGVDYTTCALSPRGYLRLAGTIDSATNSGLYASDANVVLAPWWDDLETKTSGGYVKHETQGTAPFRRFVAEWYCNLDAGYNVSDYAAAKFQCVLYETVNRFELRYGARETAGTPANTGTASIGCKGVTSVATDNYRDLAVDNLALGASKTTTTANRRHYAGEWPATTYVSEPNWPQTGRYIDLATADITGLQGPYVDPFWTFANNVNWLYCNHTPALINFTPWRPWSKAGAIDNPIHVVPVTPSADDLTYRFWIESWANSVAAFSCEVGFDDAADPQPATDADWTVETTATGPTGSGLQSWTMFELVVPASTAFVRFKFAKTNVKIQSILAAPSQIDDWDPLDVFGALNTYASGFVPMGIGQFRQRGAALHPEYLNRAWRNVARICSDRRQMIWSCVEGNDSDYALTTAQHTTRTIGVAPLSLGVEWPAQDVQVEVYAFDSGLRHRQQRLGVPAPDRGTVARLVRPHARAHGRPDDEPAGGRVRRHLGAELRQRGLHQRGHPRPAPGVPGRAGAAHPQGRALQLRHDRARDLPAVGGVHRGSVRVDGAARDEGHAAQGHAAQRDVGHGAGHGDRGDVVRRGRRRPHHHPEPAPRPTRHLPARRLRRASGGHR